VPRHDSAPKLNKTGSRDLDHSHLRVVCHPKAIADLCTKCDDSSFSRSRDTWLGPPKFKISHLKHDHAALRVVVFIFNLRTKREISSSTPHEDTKDDVSRRRGGLE